MTTDSKPRIKITYATLSTDNEELHAGSRRPSAEARTKLGWHHQNYIDGEWRDGDGHVRGALADRPRPAGRDVRDRRRAADVDARGRRGARRPAGLGRDPVARAPRDRPPGGRAHQRPPDGVLRRHGDRGRQEPDRGTRRGRGVGRPAALLLADDGGQRRLRPPDGQPRRRRRPHPLRPPAARRLRRHQPVQLPDGARDGTDRRRADRRQHGRPQALERVARCRRST